MKLATSLTFVAAWLAGVALIAWSETLPDGYLIYVEGILEPQPYSVGRVVFVSGLMTALSVGFWSLARLWMRPQSFAGVLAAQAATLGVWFVTVLFGALFTMHAPPAMAGLVRWLVFLGPVLLGLAVVMDAGYWHRRWREKRAER